jgi:hypothetical protein
VAAAPPHAAKANVADTTRASGSQILSVMPNSTIIVWTRFPDRQGGPNPRLPPVTRIDEAAGWSRRA